MSPFPPFRQYIVIKKIKSYVPIFFISPILLSWFEIADRETANNFLNTSQIAAKLADKAKLNITDGTVRKLGKALKKHGYLRLSKKIGYVYSVRVLSWDEVEQKINKKNYNTPNHPNKTIFVLNNSIVILNLFQNLILVFSNGHWAKLKWNEKSKIAKYLLHFSLKAEDM